MPNRRHSIRLWFTLALVCAGVLSLNVLSSKAADTIPSQLTDAEFWRMVTDFSEPDGAFPYENFVSNEISYQRIIPELRRLAKPGGAYLGVAPEQNFTYIAALQPKIAFIVDIRRQNMIVMLMYKALFEMAPNRVEFISRLFSRKPPTGMDSAATADAIFRAFDASPADPKLYAETLQAIKDRLLKQHAFKLVGNDEDKIGYVFNVFFKGGPQLDYAFASDNPGSAVPSYHTLMAATDGANHNWSYLESESNYRVVRDMQQRNLIVPLVGDFVGPKTIKAVAQYLKDHGAAVSAFYVSNVEDYLQPSWPRYLSNLASLPQLDPAFFIRFEPGPTRPTFTSGSTTSLRSFKDTPPLWPGRRW